MIHMRGSCGMKQILTNQTSSVLCLKHGTALFITTAMASIKRRKLCQTHTTTNPSLYGWFFMALSTDTILFGLLTSLRIIKLGIPLNFFRVSSYPCLSNYSCTHHAALKTMTATVPLAISTAAPLRLASVTVTVLAALT